LDTFVMWDNPSQQHIKHSAHVYTKTAAIARNITLKAQQSPGRYRSGLIENLTPATGTNLAPHGPSIGSSPTAFRRSASVPATYTYSAEMMGKRVPRFSWGYGLYNATPRYSPGSRRRQW